MVLLEGNGEASWKRLQVHRLTAQFGVFASNMLTAVEFPEYGFVVAKDPDAKSSTPAASCITDGFMSRADDLRPAPDRLKSVGRRSEKTKARAQTARRKKGENEGNERK